MRLIGIVVAAVGLAVGIGLGGSLAAFVDLPGLIFVLLVGGGIVLAAHGTKIVGLLLKAAIGQIQSADATPVKSAAETSVRAFVAAGWIGVIIGTVQILSELEDPSQLGVGMSVACLTAFYGYVIAYLFCMPLARSLATLDRDRIEA